VGGWAGERSRKTEGGRKVETLVSKAAGGRRAENLSSRSRKEVSAGHYDSEKGLTFSRVGREPPKRRPIKATTKLDKKKCKKRASTRGPSERKQNGIHVGGQKKQGSGLNSVA